MTKKSAVKIVELLLQNILCFSLGGVITNRVNELLLLQLTPEDAGNITGGVH